MLAAALILTASVHAQDSPATTGIMRSNGKIFVVMAVVVTILSGLFIYMIGIDRKITRLEKKSNG